MLGVLIMIVSVFTVISLGMALVQANAEMCWPNEEGDDGEELQDSV